jgi:glyoxylase-like metal-dependent hydrolase (beta-lactamase superfamily II)
VAEAIGTDAFAKENHPMTTAIPTPMPEADARVPLPISAVSLLSTGTTQIHPQHAYGSRIPMYAWILGSRAWTPPRPVNVYVIEHADGLVLFDLGQDRRSVINPDDYFPDQPIRFLYDRLARFQIRPEETLSAQLNALGYSPSDVSIAVMSHLHEDHIGGIRELPNAEFVVARAEWDAMEQPLPEPRGYLRRQIDLPGIRYRLIDFEATSDPGVAPFDRTYDLMGDGSLQLLPTPGHTPGSMSLFVSGTAGSPLLMVGDVTYEAELLEVGRIPGVGDAEGLRAASAKIRDLTARHPGLAILPAHDPGAAARLAAAR